MAVSLAHMSHEASRRRATTLPPSVPPPPPYNSSDIAATSRIPAPPFSAGHALTQFHRHSNVSGYPAANQPWVGIPVAPMSYAPEQRHSYQPGSEYSRHPASFQQSQQYCRSPIELDSSERPSLPPRPSKLQQPPSPHDSVHSSGSSSADTAPSWRTSIEPDPLPPHSNPQALSSTQSEAFTNSKPLSDISLGEDEIWSTATGLAEYRITRDASHLPKKLSSKPLLTVTRTSDGQTVGSIKFHTFTSNSIEMLLPSGRSTSISHSGLLHNRWGWQALSSPNNTGNTGEMWYWKRDRSTGGAGAMLENAKHKHGEVLARMKGDRLSFVRPRLRAEEYEEVVLSAVAMAEAARRGKRGAEVGSGDVGKAVGEMMGGG